MYVNTHTRDYCKAPSSKAFVCFIVAFGMPRLNKLIIDCRLFTSHSIWEEKYSIIALIWISRLGSTQKRWAPNSIYQQAPGWPLSRNHLNTSVKPSLCYQVLFLRICHNKMRFPRLWWAKWYAGILTEYSGSSIRLSASMAAVWPNTHICSSSTFLKELRAKPRCVFIIAPLKVID